MATKLHGCFCTFLFSLTLRNLTLLVYIDGMDTFDPFWNLRGHFWPLKNFTMLSEPWIKLQGHFCTHVLHEVAIITFYKCYHFLFVFFI